MRDLFAKLAENINNGTPVAYCRLVETRGSTPQKAGALMLVYANGAQAGTLGGGCVEAEVKRRALLTLESQTPEISTFQLDNDYGWDDGLICGGRMQVLIYPIVPQLASVVNYFASLCQLVQQGAGVTEAIAYDKSSNLQVPSHFLFNTESKLVASLPVANEVQSTVTQTLRPISQRPRPYAQHGIAYLPILPQCRLIIVGAGHVGQMVAQLAHELDFQVTVVDDRDDMASSERFPTAEQRLVGTISHVLPQIKINSDTYCLIVTRGHNHDEEALALLAQRGARYVGLIGSRRKIKLIFNDLLEQGIPKHVLQQVYAPLGIEIGSQTVAEIAISICAELVAHRNLGHVPGRPPAIEF